MKFGSLFAGIGGFDLGLERAGMSCQWQVEIEDYPIKILERHWPEVHRERDIKDCSGENLEPVDLICGGFPCQDISVAGAGAGLAGERSGLWYEMHRIIGDIKPRWVVVENVAALLSRGMDVVLRDLSTIGYDCEWHVIPASAVGARTAGNGSGSSPAFDLGLVKKPTHSVPTPTASDHIERKSTSKEKLNFETNKTVSLDRWAKMFPTPTSSMRPCEGTVRLMRQRWQDGTVTLEEANAIAGRDVRKSQCKVPAMFPTPTASDATVGGIIGKNDTFKETKNGTLRHHYQTGNNRSLTLGRYVQFFQTPSVYASEPTGSNGKLNPAWVEWLMGFPEG
jgi:hypothetical protein